MLQLPDHCAIVAARHAVPLQAAGLRKRRGVAAGLHHPRGGPGGSGEDRHLCAALCAIYHWMPGAGEKLGKAMIWTMIFDAIVLNHPGLAYVGNGRG